MPELLSTILEMQPVNEKIAKENIPKWWQSASDKEKQDWLHPCERKDLPPWWGNAVLQFFKAVVNQENESFAGQIFAEKPIEGEELIRPFTLSNLFGPFPGQLLDPNGIYRLRLTGLQKGVSDLLIKIIQSGGHLSQNSVLELDRMPFRVVNAFITSEQDPWAAKTEYATLLAERLKVGTINRHFHLSFCSPASFKVKGLVMPLPLPRLVFQSLLRRWNAFSPVAFPEETLRYAEECLVVSRFNLSSGIGTKKGRHNLQMGMLGQVTFYAVNADPYWINVLQVLASYAFFAGVGAGTSLGFGQTR